MTGQPAVFARRELPTHRHSHTIIRPRYFIKSDHNVQRKVRRRSPAIVFRSLRNIEEEHNNNNKNGFDNEVNLCVLFFVFVISLFLFLLFFFESFFIIHSYTIIISLCRNIKFGSTPRKHTPQNNVIAK